nr:hypothetical protein [Tanacetum cinerariifolium]
NRLVNRTTGKSPFEVVYGRNPITPLDLVLVPEVGWFSEEGADQSEQIKELHRLIQEQIIRNNKQYREGDLVWIYLRKERFPAGRFGRGDDADAVNERVNVTNTLGTYFTTTNFCGGLG